MRILFSAIHYPVSASQHLANAFRKLGHEVITIGPAAGGHLPWSPQTDFSAYEWKPDIALPYPSPRTMSVESDRALNSMVWREINLVVQCDANFFLTGYIDCPNVCYAIDNHVARYDETEFELFFGAHSWGYHSQDSNFVWMPCAYSPESHYEIKGFDKRADAAFVGVPYAHRAELLQALAPFGAVVAAVGLLGSEYNEFYNQARIGVCLSACGDVPMRVFENAAQGLLVFCDRQRDLPKLGLVEGDDYVAFDSIPEAVDKFRYLLSRPDEVERIAKSGQQKLAGATWEARAQAIIERVKGGKYADSIGARAVVGGIPAYRRDAAEDGRVSRSAGYADAA